MNYLRGNYKVLNITLSALLCITLLFTSPVFAYSESNTSTSEYQITTLDELKSVLSDLYDKVPSLAPESPEIEDLLSKTNPDVIQEFVSEKFNALQKATSDPSSFSYSHTINLGDNCYVKINAADAASNENEASPGISILSTPGAQTLWKDYGARKFTSTFEGNFILASFKLNMCNHYTLDSKGIVVRSIEAWGNGGGAMQVSHGAVNGAEKGDRAKVGKTLSADCIFTVSLAGLGQKSFKMYNKVKCSEIDTVGKQVKVVQSWNGKYLK